MRAIKTLLAASSIFAAILSQALAAEHQIYYGSRAGMSLTTVSKEGIGTSEAVIRVEHTPQNAKAYCVEYELDNSMECVRRTMAEVQVNDRVTADCEQKTWVDVYGGRYAFLGPNESNQVSADYTVKDLDTGEILDGSSASGYPVVLDTFKALCPGIAK